jgi:YfiH family protein
MRTSPLENPVPLFPPDWPAPQRVIAGTTLRPGGHSASPYAGWNFAEHVGDLSVAVAKNRRQLVAQFNTDRPIDVQWLTQTHSDVVLAANASSCKRTVPADAAFTMTPGIACCVMTADCLPVLLCDAEATAVAAIHAGWRGLAGGIIGNTIECLARVGVKPGQLLAWLGPAIGPDHFEVGEDVFHAMRQAVGGRVDFSAAFYRSSPDSDRYQADIYCLARKLLLHHGVGKIWGGGECTVCDPERFFSYRRDGSTGRMASYIYLDS